MKRTLAHFLCALLPLAAACDNDGGARPPIDSTLEQPTFDWGYPSYSEYVDGKHVGTHFYQRDLACRERLTFYMCDAVDASLMNTPANNPTGASGALTGGLDTCTAAIESEQPSYCMPADVCNPSKQSPAWAPGQASVDNLSWQLFVAINWPANPDEPGYPDPSKDLGAVDDSGTGHARAVWLDYPTPEDLFGVPSPCEGELTLSMTAKVSDAFLAKEPPLAALPGGVVQPGGGVLVDQNKKIVYDDIRINRTEWEFIVNQNDYWRTGTSLDDIPPNLRRDYSQVPGMTAGAFPAALDNRDGPDEPVDVGSMEIKAAWKQLSPDEIAAGTFYTQTMTLYDPSAAGGEQCAQRVMGLVGLHIMYMPAQFGNPEWIWATFEHRLNTPTSGINEGDTSFSFYSADCVSEKTAEECAAFEIGVDSPEEFRCCPNLKLYASVDDLPSDSDPVPNQVTRLTNPTVSTVLPTHCNERHANAITNFFGADNVWKNYFLVSAQWPLRGPGTNRPFYAPPFEANLPCLLRNSTIETFGVSTSESGMNGCDIDPGAPPGCRRCNGDCVAAADIDTPCTDDAAPPVQFNTATCMGCHAEFAPNNSSFILTHRPCCVRSDGAQPNDCGNLLMEASCEANEGCAWISSDPQCG